MYALNPFFSRQLTLQIDDKDLPAVHSLLKSTSNMLRQLDSYKNKHTLREDSSAHDYKQPEFLFVPIFPKAQRQRSAMAPAAPLSAGLKGLKDLPPKILAQAAVEHSDDDISMQNLKVVDGWGEIYLS